RLAVDAAHLAQVPVRLAADLLRVQARHNIRSYTHTAIKSNTQPTRHQGKLVKPATQPASQNHDQLKLRLAQRVAGRGRWRLEGDVAVLLCCMPSWPLTPARPRTCRSGAGVHLADLDRQRRDAR